MTLAELDAVLLLMTDAEINALILRRHYAKQERRAALLKARSERRYLIPRWPATNPPALPLVRPHLRASRYVPTRVRTEVLSSGPCARCGAPNDLQVDHVIPVARGGTGDRANLQPLCFGCNSRKRDRV